MKGYLLVRTNNSVWLLTVAALILFCSSLKAQVTTATITGFVTDQTGAVVPDAQVTVTEAATAFTRSTRSGGDGAYALSALPVGTYTITVEHPGFKKYVQGGFGPLVLGQVARADIVLQVGVVTQEVTVTGGAQVVPTSVSQTQPVVVNDLAIKELPVNGRNVLSLIGLYSGATIVGYNIAQTGDGGVGSAEVNGGRDVSMNYRLDGVNNASGSHGPNVYPPPDSVEEFTLITHDFSAQYGGNSAAILEAITKSGTNAYHGAAWEYNRNTDLDARNAFAPSRTALVQNQFGVNAGGPILKNKLFVFGSYQGLRIAQAVLLTGAEPPTAAERVGNFSAFSGTIINPATGAPFAGNIITTPIDPVANNLLAYIPLPNMPNGTYVTTFPEPLHDNQYNLKGDWDLGSKDRISVRFSHYGSGTTGTNGDYPSYSSSIYNFYEPSLAAHWIRNISPTLLNSVVFGYTSDGGNNLNKQDLYAEQLGVSSTLGENGTGVFETPPYFNIVGRTCLSCNGIGGFSGTHQFDLVDNVTWIKGSHTFKFGGEWQWNHWRNIGGSEDNGRWSFDGSITGDAMSDFYLGQTSEFEDNSPYNVKIKFQGYDFYAQDDYKLSRKLTLNFGLRWEISKPFTDFEQVTGRPASATFLPNCATTIDDPFPQCVSSRTSKVFPTAPPGLFFGGDPGVPVGLYNTPLGNFQPRIGLAYDPFGKGKTAIRVAFGKFTDSPYTSYGIDLNQPWLLHIFRYDVPMDNPAGGVTYYPFTPPAYGAPYTFALPATDGGIQPDFHEADVYQWNLTVDQQLPRGIGLEASYVGTQSSHLLFAVEGNPVRFFPGTNPNGTPISTVANIDSRRVYAYYTTMWSMQTSANASYDGLQLNLTKRGGRGLYLTAGYTLSKTIDFRSGSGLFGSPVVQDPFNIHAEKALSNFDSRNVFTFGPVYTVPHLSSLSPAARGFLGDWEVSAVVRAQSGNPFTIVDGVDQVLQGTGQRSTGMDRPDLVGNPHISNSSRADAILHWFNTAAFALQPLGSYGNVGRNTVIGPGFWSADISLVKNIPIGERFKVQLRGEFFNSFNNVNLNTPQNSVTDPLFGQILSAGAPRIGQLVAKVIW